VRENALDELRLLDIRPYDRWRTDGVKYSAYFPDTTKEISDERKTMTALAVSAAIGAVHTMVFGQRVQQTEAIASSDVLSQREAALAREDARRSAVLGSAVSAAERRRVAANAAADAADEAARVAVTEAATAVGR
jgi:hypothetical protein